MLFNVDIKLWIRKVCQQHLPEIRNIYRVKESPWSRVYHVLTAEKVFLCKVGPLSSGVTNEYRALSFLSTKRIQCVPQVICYREGKDQALLLTPFIHQSGSYNAVKLGENLARIHSLKHSKKNCEEFILGLLKTKENELSDLKYVWRQEALRRIRLLERAGDILKQMNSLYRKQRKFFAKDPARFIHMDAQDAVIPNEDQMYFVDWHMAGYGDPAYDLARLCEYEHQRTPLFDKGDFLKAYTGGNKLAESMAWRMDYYGLASRIALLLYSFGDCANLVRYRASPLVVSVRERDFLVKLVDHKIGAHLQKIQSDMERLSA
ncbi:MAG: aminoglycoside phosphotransferase family protein [Candidatus Omnitrophica bacterium]|nr:aminoglycoside phosphotransferase family protein [Candidatus Omnitrophota bacterium]